MITDPPFNVGYHYDTHSDSMAESEYLELIKATIRPPCVVIHYPEAMFDVARALGHRPERQVAWVYPSNTPRQHRSIAWFGCRPDFRLDGQDYKNPTDKRIAKRIADGKRARLYDWWEINQIKNVGKEKTGHPCQMPLEVMLRIIRITRPEIVFDPFMGSGTTLIAAKMLGVPSMGADLSEAYCRIAVDRIATLHA